MLLFGHPLITSDVFYRIMTEDAVAKTPANSTVLVTFEVGNLALIHHVVQNDISLALAVESVEELVFAHNLQARYVLVSETFAPTAQKLAEEYLFDAKVLCHLEDNKSFESLALKGIDGVIYNKAIVSV